MIVPGTAAIPDILREVLACPVDHAPLLTEDEHLVCTVCGRRFAVDAAGVPDMVVVEG
jgi:uncharacterized protein YbaR (Trm112 family)